MSGVLPLLLLCGSLDGISRRALCFLSGNFDDCVSLSLIDAGSVQQPAFSFLFFLGLTKHFCIIL